MLITKFFIIYLLPSSLGSFLTTPTSPVLQPNKTTYHSLSEPRSNASILSKCCSSAQKPSCYLHIHTCEHTHTHTHIRLGKKYIKILTMVLPLMVKLQVYLFIYRLFIETCLMFVSKKNLYFTISEINHSLIYSIFGGGNFV